MAETNAKEPSSVEMVYMSRADYDALQVSILADQFRIMLLTTAIQRIYEGDTPMTMETVEHLGNWCDDTECQTILKVMREEEL